MESTTLMEFREAWKDAKKIFMRREVVGKCLRAWLEKTYHGIAGLYYKRMTGTRDEEQKEREII